MREVNASEITNIVKQLCIENNINLDKDVTEKIIEFEKKEDSPIGKQILEQILINAKLATEENRPMCLDTGIAVIFVELGQDVHISKDNFYDAINEGVKRGYTQGYLRKSVVEDPVFDRKNTKDNTPAIIHTDIIPGDKIKITVASKGAGSEPRY